MLRETLRAFEESRDRFHQLATGNLARWGSRTAEDVRDFHLLVLPGDWGVVTQAMTARFGHCFAVLNMANPYVPGGAYVEGAVAQEENMFRRTDCHLRITADEYDTESDRYVPRMTRLVSGQDGIVYLDVERPRVCIRGPEDPDAPDLGYRWLSDDEVFPFFELRAAARDLRDGSAFDPADARRRIAAQLDTLRRAGVRHAVLGASGCGAFRNPSREVAAIYRDEIEARISDFAVIAFAIFDAGYGPGNYGRFAEILGASA